jgi:hypothetical protein
MRVPEATNSKEIARKEDNKGKWLLKASVLLSYSTVAVVL